MSTDADDARPLPPFLRTDDGKTMNVAHSPAKPTYTSTSTMRAFDGSRLNDKKEVASDAGSSTTKFTKKWYTALGLGLLGCYFVWHPDPTVRMRVRGSVLAPDGVSAMQEGIDGILFSFALIFFVAIADLAVARNFGPARYFALHVIINAINIYFAFPDVITTFSTPQPFEMNTCLEEGRKCANKFSIALTIALHSWHMLAYTLAPIDLVHHVPSQVVCVGAIFLPWGPAVNVNVFNFMGLPGGIDYFLLVLVKLKLMHPGTEKDVNQTLNVWLRCPLGVIIAFIMVFGAITQPDSAYWPGYTHRFAQAAMGLQQFWNACFFMYRTVDARTRFIQKQQALKAAEAKEKPN